MISVNKVRNTVLSLLNKNNRGAIGAVEFDYFSDLAQRDLFENLFYRLNKWENNKAKKYNNNEYADITKNIQEQIDRFSGYTTSNFTYNAIDDLYSYIGTDFYRTEGISLVNAQGKKKDIQEVYKGAELNNAINSTINSPSVTYPIYVKIGENYRIYPKAPVGYTVELFYIRTPKSPKWTYTLDANGNPLYNAGAIDKQDFELDEPLFVLLVIKILSYCGLSIKEADVVQIASNEQLQTEQKET